MSQQSLDPGLRWFPQARAGWIRLEIKRAASYITDGAHISPDTEGGVYDFVSTKDLVAGAIDFGGSLKTTAESFSYLRRMGCRPALGDLLFSKDGTVGRTALVKCDRDFVVASSLIIIRPARGIVIPRFLQYLSDSEPVQAQVRMYVKGAGLPRLSISNLRRVWGLFPPIHIQHEIAKFLDRETAQIDELIGKQNALIELLGERRKAVITRAVTRGLDSDVTMKASGVPWLGEVPAHWTVSPLKRSLVRVENGVSPQAEGGLAGPGEWGVLKSGCVNGGQFNDTEHKKLPPDFQFSPELEVRVGDVLVCRASGSVDLVGSCAQVVKLSYHLILSDKTFRLRPNHRMFAQLLAWTLNSASYRAQVATAISGAEGLANNLPSSSLKNFVFPVPPMSEQIQIAQYLEEKTQQLDHLLKLARRSIELLQERRSALITAAVTGTIDLRGAA